MNLKNDAINKLISGKFEIDCIDINLIQQVEKDPIIHNGSGTIYQDKNGVLNLKLYAEITNKNRMISHILKHFVPGKIIGNENYFSLRATDMSGGKWDAENLWLSHNVYDAGQVIKAKLREIKNITEADIRIRSEKTYLFIVVPGSYKIPCNEKEDLPNGGWHLNKSLFSFNQIDFEFKKLDNYLTINASTETNALPEQSEIRILEALSIICGQIVRPMIIDLTHGGIRTLTIKSVDDTFPNNRLSYPLQHSSPSDLGTFANFFEGYLSSIESPNSELFGFWYKINRAWQSGIENASLALAVAIEGIVKSYFKKHGLPDKEILQQAPKAKQLIKHSELGEKIKQRLLSSIGGLKIASPQGALYQMSDMGLFPKSFVVEWLSLRNKSVHPHQIDRDEKIKQVNINKNYTCLVLFYCLLFKVIGYEGNFIDYSQEGWPEKSFSLVRKE